ncbi:hypothetical protein A3D69_03490 [Candidatus Uhrbacteria bacterium RIFCSPHIGHO2_02_FULL_54_11]|nr:MAG: hypothetical protein A3D69_03490 [Candidatus Uhrbacteria bacterium RIFCSPHIGHO2_02_FULL_54_11]
MCLDESVARSLVEEVEAGGQVLRGSPHQSSDGRDGLAEGGEDPDAEESREPDRERDQHADAHGHEFRTQDHVRSGVAHNRSYDAQAVLEERQEARHERGDGQHPAALVDGFGGLRVAQSLRDGDDSLRGGPGKRHVVQDHPSWPCAHEDAEVGRDHDPDGDLPPRRVEPDVGLEDVLDVVERGEDHTHESHAAHHSDHGLDDIELIGEGGARDAATDDGRGEEHAGEAEIHPHAELEGGVGHGGAGDDAEKSSEEDGAPVEAEAHGVLPM